MDKISYIMILVMMLTPMMLMMMELHSSYDFFLNLRIRRTFQVHPEHSFFPIQHHGCSMLFLCFHAVGCHSTNHSERGPTDS